MPAESTDYASLALAIHVEVYGHEAEPGPDQVEVVLLAFERGRLAERNERAEVAARLAGAA